MTKLAVDPNDDGILRLQISGDSFAEDLARAKTIPGRRFNGADKIWEFPNSPEALLKIVHTIEPELSKALQGSVQEAKAEAREAIITHLPDDAALSIPWRDRLTPAQRAGIDFMVEHPHALLADDPGSGKTVQSISTVYERVIRKTGGIELSGRPVLVVAPNSVLRHWKREIMKWTHVPEERIEIIEGDASSRADSLARIDAGEVEWAIVNWEKLQAKVGLVGKDAKHPGRLAKIPWVAVIADEAHRAKNRTSQQSKGLRRLTADIQIAATGTPVMNNPGELWPLLRWLAPEAYSSYWNFFHTYSETYEGYRGKPVVIGVKNADGLRFELADKMVRRTRREIHPDMKEPHDPIIYESTMTALQKKVYKEVENQFWVELAKEVAEHPETARDPDEFRGQLAAGEIDLETIKLMIPTAAVKTLRLRQVATSPAVIGGEDSSGKLDDVVEVVTQDDRPWVLFAWFKPTVELIAGRLRDKGMSVKTFTGDTHTDDRAEIAAEFQAGGFQTIVCTLSAGGVGIDLYRAADCGFIEEDWTPAINDQAFGRIDRKGQQQRPQRHIWRTRGTVDTGNIAPTNATKRLITETIIGG